MCEYHEDKTVMYGCSDECSEENQDWFNWAIVEKQDYRSRQCFDEPEQKAIMILLSCADPRGSDIAIEVTENSKNQILVKVENSRTLTYYPYQKTEIQGSYTVITFGENKQ